MTIDAATKFIEKLSINNTQPTTWADLGCGSGTFTKALSNYLGKNSNIYAVDVQPQSITSTKHVAIEFNRADFINEVLPFEHVDGILMANSLHYVTDKQQLIIKLKKHLTENGQFLIVEYETDIPNHWMPYPIKFNELKQLFLENGFKTVQYLGERKSIYGSANLYACSISF